MVSKTLKAPRVVTATLGAGALALAIAGAFAASSPSLLGSATSANRPAGEVFSDPLRIGEYGPSVVVVAPGQFRMGSPEDEAGRYANEGPQRTVRFNKAFSLGRTEVTVADFRRFVDSTGYVTTAERTGGSLQRDPETGAWAVRPDLNWRVDPTGKPAHDDLPVVHVSWEDATAFASWLSVQTGQRYRLPSEAELEYANRAGTATAYAWGDGAPPKPVANIKGERDTALMPVEWQTPDKDEIAYAEQDGPTPTSFAGYGDGFGTAAPVASFAANQFGLYDTTGNVWEWTSDCWHESYRGAPADGSAWMGAQAGDCGRRVLRGGSFYCFPRHLRAANRWAELPAFRNMYVGFRIARDL
jgi:formylglycine-generating enzyme required for sulfatase activity